MIVIMKKEATEEQIKKVVDHIEKKDSKSQSIKEQNE